MEAKTASSAFPYLRSCKQETENAITGEIRGEVPKWLKGTLIRIGSGLLEVGSDKFNHVFDGLSLMHKFQFKHGKVTYQNRFLRSDTYRRNMKANKIVVSEFGTRGAPDPCRTIFQRFVSLFSLDDFTDNDLVTVVMYGDEAYACSESNCIWKIDPDTLESIEKVKLSDFIPVNAAIAHAHEDINGTVYNVGTAFKLSPCYYIVKFPPKEDRKANPFQNGSVVCKIPSSKFLSCSYHHSFGMTENYFVFVEQPLYMSIPKIAWAHFVAGTYADAMSWDDTSNTRFHVVRKADGQLLDTVYLSKATFVFHHINTYEEDDQIVVDMCCYDQGGVVNALYVKALEELFSSDSNYSEPFQSRAKRYVLPLSVEESGKNLVTLHESEATAYRQSDGSIYCIPEILTGADFWSPELPRINYERFNGKKYQYFYGIAKNEMPKTTHLVKVDTCNKVVESWSEEGTIPSEPVFIPERNANTADEDSGVLLASLLFTNDEKKVSMLILDAKTMKEIGRVNFTTVASVPGDFHGTFIPK